ncbi:hypothetical protein CANMA_001476 [Candida margitis]|uniref:uncharacterized protein n=1 Tax=Candida margitis TaxID=1775924 RepID=UPI002227B5C6|nr:uncharacterized protein CANMA_001476 [Candida margitis]KAI5969409.1 hypothetical protein CANMA_001476 [Candida margitis]
MKYTSMDIVKHNHIPKNTFSRLRSNLKYIDSTLSLHFINHVANPLAHDILQQASNLAQWKINIEDLENILAISPMYKIYRNENGTYMSFPDRKGQDRVGEFTELLNKWIASHQHGNALARLNLCDVWIRTSSPRKISKSYASYSNSTLSPSPSPSPTKSRHKFADLKNHASKFTFKEKDAQEESNKHQGMSLLERIKLKEKLSNSKGVMTKEEKHERYLAARMDRIYDIIHQLYLDSGVGSNESSSKSLSLSLTKIVQVVRDSCDENQMDNDDISRVIHLISGKLDNFTVIEKSGILILRVSHLNRHQDLPKLNSGAD